MRPFLPLFLLGGVSIALASCDAASRPTEKEEMVTAIPSERASQSNAAKAAAKPHIPDSRPQTLLDDPSSAYAATVLPRGDEVLVTTPTHLFRLAQDKPMEKIPARLGEVQILHEDSIAFLRDGKIRTLSLEGRGERVIVTVEHYVQYLLSSGPRLAWLSHQRQGRYFIQTESAGSVKTLYTSRKQVMWPVVHDEIVYFLEQSEGVWKIGRAALDGRPVTFGTERRGRVPAMLAVGPDGLYFYDGPKRGVRKLAFDLSTEEPIAEDTICSPLAVSSRVVCAQVGGVTDIARKGADPRTIAQETDGPIADIAATDARVYWIVDRGRDQMAVRSAPLPGL